MDKTNAALQILLERHKYLIAKIASSFPKNNVTSYEDYLSTGIIALIHAFRTYDKSKGAVWEKYLFVCVRNAIAREANRFIGPFTFSDWEIDRRFLVSKLCREKELSNKQIEQVAKSLKISPKILKAIKKILKPMEVELDSIKLEPTVNIHIDPSKFDFLSARDKQVIQRSLDGESLKKIGQSFDVSYETIRRWRQQAFEEISRRFTFDDFVV